MSGSLPKYSSGGIGPKSRPLTFSDLNRITRATEIVEGMNVGERGQRGAPRSHFFASLVEQTGTFGGLPLWSWSQIGAADGGIVSQEGLLTSATYEEGQGLAIQFGENASPGDYVLLHELPSADGKRRFGFTGGGGSSSSLGLSLSIESSTLVTTNTWRYSVVQGYTSLGGEFIQTGELGTMWNLYEGIPYGHGQSLAFSKGTLTVLPLQGVVFGALSLIEDEGETRVYVCDVPNPMSPQCTAGAGASPEAPPAVLASKAYQILTWGI